MLLIPSQFLNAHLVLRSQNLYCHFTLPPPNWYGQRLKPWRRIYRLGILGHHSDAFLCASLVEVESNLRMTNHGCGPSPFFFVQKSRSTLPSMLFSLLRMVGLHPEESRLTKPSLNVVKRWIASLTPTTAACSSARCKRSDAWASSMAWIARLFDSMIASSRPVRGAVCHGFSCTIALIV